MNSGLKCSSSACAARCRPTAPPAHGQVRGHDQHGVLEVDGAALAVGQAAVVHHLQQRVEDVGVGLLDLVEQHDRVGAAAHGLGQLAALVVADVAGRRADEARDGVFLHVLGHVDADHRVLRVEHELGERACELGLADAGRPEEQERADRAVGVLQAGARAAQRGGDGLDRLVLADDAFVQALLHVDQLLGLALEQAADGDAGPARDDLGDVVGVDLLLEEHRRRAPSPRLRRAVARWIRARRAASRARGSPRSAARRRAAGRLRARRARPPCAPPRGAPSARRRPRSRPSRSATAPSSRRSARAARRARARSPRGAPRRPRRSPCAARSARSRAASRGGRPRRSRSAASRSRCAAARRPRRPGRSPCRAGSGRRCSGRRASRRRSARCPGCARRGGPRSAPSGRAGSRSCPRPRARRPSPAGSGARARRPSRCACGTRRAWSRRRRAVRRARASA